jgi:hypothetical protein
MKILSSTPERGPRSGNGNGNGNGKSGIPSQARYDTSVRFDHGVRYADGAVPVDDGAKAKLDLAARADQDLLQFARTHDVDITANADIYPAPIPTGPVFGGLITTFATAITDAESAKNASKAAFATKDAARLALETAFNQRRNYVQIASNGNAAAILNAGLPIQNARQPKGPLPAPMNVRIELNDVAAAMTVLWDAVAGNEGYLVRCSKDVTPRDWSQLKRNTKPRLELEHLDIGTTYVFQVAAAGGDTGQSPWSPEVKRTAA